jgi:glycosyltransferase involved in cell wall biosynthesis
MKLSAIIPAHKSDSLLKQAIASVSFADEVIILWDTDSAEDLPTFSSKVKVVKHSLNKSFAVHRNFALKQALGDWVLFLDSDEQVSTKLANQIQTAIQKDNKTKGYLILRQDIYFNQKLNNGETGETKILRLARRNAGKFVRAVHESWDIKGEIKELTSPILHYRSQLTTPFIERMILYSPLDATELDRESKPFTYWRLILYPKAKFFQNYILRLGLLDGLLGLFHAYLMSVQSLTVRVYQWENRK